jgi:hypothetical protein
MVKINEYQKWLDKMIEKVREEDIVLSKKLYGFTDIDSSESESDISAQKRTQKPPDLNT